MKVSKHSRKKAISPLIAVVLLIAFTITIGTILVSWVTSYTSSQTKEVETKSTERIKCSFGSLDIQSVTYNHTSTKLTIRVENKAGDTDLSNILFDVVLVNSSTYTYRTTCNCADETLRAAETKVYSNSSIESGCDIDRVRVTTNCVDAYDTKTKDDITFSDC